MATNTGPDQWRHESAAYLATALDVLAIQADEIKRARKGKG